MRIALATLALMIGVSQAVAGGGFTPLPEYEDKKSWDRVYLGLSGAHSSNSENYYYFTFENRSYLLGGHVGIDRQLGNTVFGLRGGVEFGVDSSLSWNDVDTVYGAIARAGFLVTQNSLLYGLVGYEHKQNDTLSDLKGGVIGGGLEVRFSDDSTWSAGAEFNKSLDVNNDNTTVRFMINKALY